MTVEERYARKLLSEAIKWMVGDLNPGVGDDGLVEAMEDPDCIQEAKEAVIELIKKI